MEINFSECTHPQKRSSDLISYCPKGIEPGRRLKEATTTRHRVSNLMMEREGIPQNENKLFARETRKANSKKKIQFMGDDAKEGEIIRSRIIKFCIPLVFSTSDFAE